MTRAAMQHKPNYKPFKTLNEAYARRVSIWVCKSCGIWCQTAKPKVCTSCGGDAFWYFASKAEAKRFEELRLLERYGKIKDLRTQMNFPCYVNDVLVTTYRADFVYIQDGVEIVEDVKPATRDQVKVDKRGKVQTVSRDKLGKTDLFEIKRKLVKAVYDVEIQIVRR